MELLVKDGRLKVVVKPNSSKNEVLGFDSSRDAYKIAVKAAADKGKANKELVNFVSKLLGKRVEIVSGKTNRVKVLKTKGL